MTRRFGPIVTALVMLALLAGVRLTLRADTGNVWLLGRRTGSECTFRQHFGIPCPNCGMSRSVILSMHGNLREAAMLNPAGPLLVAGVLAAALMLIGAASAGRNAALVRWILPSVLIYSGIYVAMLMIHWLIEIL